ncbi:SDR family oxidoreductase [Nocardioides sp. IC4_145]|uniref:SDR family oxidoreductase n=1 Tax=Nocardioides sp. IC4_145 TaxID=2714037 RepID=UPI001F6127CD|nr:SDR family oxidoreductase [Nocardioides sp. IC4_145]
MHDRPRHRGSHRRHRLDHGPGRHGYSPEPFAIPRLAEPTDVTRLLLFLASSDASFVTGSEHVVDGGLLLGPALQAEAA